MNRNFVFAMALVCMCLAGCKPTEKNYKSAYDAALEKRQAAVADLGVEIDGTRLEQVDGAQLREVDGVSVYVLNERISPADFISELPGNYNVAVGKYKMITNSKSQSEVLQKSGLHAFPAKNSEDYYYTIAASFPSLTEAVEFYKNYQKNEGNVFVGLPGAPIIIYSPK